MLAKTILELSVHKTLKMLWRNANYSSYIIRLQHNATLDATTNMQYSTIQLHSQKCASCSKSAAGLLPCSHQADIRIRPHRMLARLDDNKSAASCQQT